MSSDSTAILDEQIAEILRFAANTCSYVRENTKQFPFPIEFMKVMRSLFAQLEALRGHLKQNKSLGSALALYLDDTSLYSNGTSFSEFCKTFEPESIQPDSSNLVPKIHGMSIAVWHRYLQDTLVFAELYPAKENEIDDEQRGEDEEKKKPDWVPEDDEEEPEWEPEESDEGDDWGPEGTSEESDWGSEEE